MIKSLIAISAALLLASPVPAQESPELDMDAVDRDIEKMNRELEEIEREVEAINKGVEADEKARAVAAAKDADVAIVSKLIKPATKTVADNISLELTYGDYYNIEQAADVICPYVINNARRIDTFEFMQNYVASRKWNDAHLVLLSGLCAAYSTGYIRSDS